MLAATSGDRKSDKHSKNIFVSIYVKTLVYEKKCMALAYSGLHFVPGKRTLEKSNIKSA